MYYIKADEIFLEDRILANGTLAVNNGLITAIDPGQMDSEAEIIDLKGMKLMPGFIDIHVHGGNGCDTMDLTYEAVNNISKFKIKEGVTSFCPSTVTTDMEKTHKAIVCVKQSMEKGVEGAQIIGSFLEGPYINPVYKGAHPIEHIRDVQLGEIESLINIGEGTVNSFAIAPEKENALEAIRYLNSKGVIVRIGHSEATIKQANEAVCCGASVGIHTYNAMSPLNHREPGMVGAIMTNDNLYAELICDLVHVAPEAAKVLVKAKGTDKVILITDCMMAGGMADGKYNLGDLAVLVQDGVARIESGNLAGSTLTVIKAIRNMHEVLGVPLFHTVKMSTQNPAKAVGVFHDRGSLTVGKRADLTAIDADFNVRFVMCGGEIKQNI